jgi:alkanesulfonate monooxygenase SsuD/methylene tetrahydromethanopterin reductase-like flavin-dependent oxidoreductase (luciferase family)
LTYHGEFYQFDDLPMRLRPKQKPYPPLWYMRNVEIAAVEGMHCIIVGNLDSFEPNVVRYHHLWKQHHGEGAKTLQGTDPKIGLVTHMVVADTEDEAMQAARPAWEAYVWNLTTPRRLEAERRGLTQFLGSALNPRPAGLPDREAGAAYRSTSTISAERQQRRAEPGQVTEQSRSAGFRVLAGTPQTIRRYLDEYLTTGANYFVCAFHFGNMPETIAERSIELFINEVMPYYQ